MSSSFDTGPLAWVKTEIDLALSRADEALLDHQKSRETTPLRFARTHLHQAHGALAMVGLDGATQLSQSLEALLLQAEEAGELAALPVARNTIQAIRQYVDEVAGGQAHQPLRLLPALETLAAARNLPAPHPAELFFPDLTLRPTYSAEAAPTVDPEIAHATLKRERAHFQKGLLSWLKKPDESELARQTMRQALAGIEALHATAATRSFWSIAQALMAALGHPKLGADARARQLCSLIDGQIKRLLEGSGTPPDRLLREALYFIAQVPVDHDPLIARISQTFDLPALLPDQRVSHSVAPLEETGLRQLREILGDCESQWNKHCAGTGNLLPGFAHQARQVAQRCAELGQTDLKRLGQGLSTVANWLLEHPAEHNEGTAMEIATSILLLQNACDHFRKLGTDFASQVDLMVARLHGRMAGIPPSGADLPLLDDFVRRAQESLLIGQVAREIRNNLAQIEQGLDVFFRDPEQRSELPALEAPLKQIGGALTMLGHLAAAADIKHCAGQIKHFADPDYTPLDSDFEALAHQLSLLGFFADALEQGEHDYAAFVARYSAQQQDAAEPASSAATPTVDPLPATNDGADDPALLDTPPLPTPELPAPSAETLKLAEASHETLDAELLSIFLEEAREVLGTLAAQRDLLRQPPHPPEALTAIRRATHTLKGSGRMVGLRELGEAAWELEQTFNLWLRQEQAVNADLLHLIDQEIDLFSDWIAGIAANQSPSPDSRALIALAQRLRGSEPDSLALPATPALSPTPAPADVETALDEQPEIIEADQADAWLDALPEDKAEAGDTAPAEAPGEPETLCLDDVDPALLATADALAELLGAPEEAPPARTETPAAPSEANGPQIKISPTLYDIFRAEAQDHLQVLVSELARLGKQPASPTAFAFMRAAHTLAGIAATVGLMPIHHLAHALELALIRRDTAARPDCADGLDTLHLAIDTLGQQFAALAKQGTPDEADTVIAALSEAFSASRPGPADSDAAADTPPAADHDDLPPAVESAAEPARESIGESSGAAPLTASDNATPAKPIATELPLLNDEIDAQLLPIFLAEAEEQLPALAAKLRAWRTAPDDREAPAALRRLLHTFKGGARMAGAMNLGEVAHLLESRIEQLAGSAHKAALLDEIETAIDTLSQGVEQLRHPASPEAAPSSQPAAATVNPSPALDQPNDSQQATLRIRADLVDRLVNEAGELAISRSRIEGEMRSLKGSLLDLTENVIRLRRQLREIEIQAETQMQAGHSPTGEGQDEAFDPLELDRFTRFQELTRFMAESVNDVATVQQTLLKSLDDTNAALIAQSRLNRSLQQELMSVRMLPFASQNERLYRVTRQTARDTGKRASLDILGGHVTVDRSVLEKILGPLEHMLRNALTHGIEMPAERLKAGKAEIGEITLGLAQEGNEIIITLQDDGRGLDLDAIARRGEALGLLSPGQQADASQLTALIFEAGFSTASELTQAAGRGVGMDVVKTEIASLGGRVEVQSLAGRGCTFRLYLPLTLAVTSTLLVRAGDQVHALPSTMIEQVMDLKEKPLAAIRAAGEVEWQDKHYPFHYLPHLLGDGLAQPVMQRQYHVLLLRSGSQRMAVQVDALLGNQEVVVKNIGPQLARVPGIAGATVLGDGRVVLILNPPALHDREALSAQPLIAAESAPLPTILVVDDSLTVRKFTSRLLSRAGYQVLLAKDGLEAMDVVADTLPDAILSDIEMPRMDGFELVRNLRADERLRDTPIVMITSRTADKHRQHALALGATHYLGKPYDEGELLALLAADLGERAPTPKAH